MRELSVKTRHDSFFEELAQRTGMRLESIVFHALLFCRMIRSGKSEEVGTEQVDDNLLKLLLNYSRFEESVLAVRILSALMLVTVVDASKELIKGVDEESYYALISGLASKSIQASTLEKFLESFALSLLGWLKRSKHDALVGD